MAWFRRQLRNDELAVAAAMRDDQDNLWKHQRDREHRDYLIRFADPKTVLEDIRMKRDLLDEYEAVAHLDTDGPPGGYAHGRAVGLGEAVKTVAAAYCHRPGWKDSWGA